MIDRDHVKDAEDALHFFELNAAGSLDQVAADPVRAIAASLLLFQSIAHSLAAIAKRESQWRY